MKYEMTNVLPVRKYHHLQNVIKEFAESDSQYLILRDWEDEYKDLYSLRSAWYGAALRSKYAIKCHLRQGIVYLEKVI